MEWWTVAALALYLASITVAASNARDEDWGRRKSAGTAVFLAGAGFALFFDDVAAATGVGMAIPNHWVEYAAVAVLLLGLAVAYSGSDGDD